jgi:hypothetical protein
LKQKKLPVLRDIQYGRLLFFNSTVFYTYNHCTGTVDYRTTGIRDIRLLTKFLTVYTCITFNFFALALGKKGVFYSYKKISVLHFCNWKKNALWNRIFVLGKNCPFMTNNKNMVKRVKNQNHTCTIHRNTTNSFIPLGSNIQFSTNTEKEQVIIKKTCNNEQIEFLCV